MITTKDARDNTFGKEALVAGESSAVVLANKPHQEVNINKISPDQNGPKSSDYVSRREKDY
jgi:hypothetical protein